MAQFDLLGAMENEESIKDTEYLIRGHKNAIRCIKTDMEDGTGYERRLEDLNRRIDKLVEYRDRLVSNRDNGHDLIVEHRAAIEKLEAKLETLKGGRRLAQLIKLAQQINAIKGELEPEKLAANLEHLEEAELAKADAEADSDFDPEDLAWP